MVVNHLGLDIETAPIRPLSDYSPAIQEKVYEKISRIQERKPEFDYVYFASIHGDFGKIICISLGYIAEDDTIRLKSLIGEDEYQILSEFNEIIGRHKGIYLHYNGLNFDIPFILQRMSHHGIAPADPRFSDLRRFSTNPHFDVMMQYYNWDMQKVLPLGVLAELHGLPSPKESLSGEKVYEAFQNKAWEQITHYCEFDTATTLNLWNKIFYYKAAIPLENYRFSNR
ncbi:MAG: 3'-5' exonuclease [Calditrichia bacterium]